MPALLGGRTIVVSPLEYHLWLNQWLCLCLLLSVSFLPEHTILAGTLVHWGIEVEILGTLVLLLGTEEKLPKVHIWSMIFFLCRYLTILRMFPLVSEWTLNFLKYFFLHLLMITQFFLFMLQMADFILFYDWVVFYHIFVCVYCVYIYFTSSFNRCNIYLLMDTGLSPPFGYCD